MLKSRSLHKMSYNSIEVNLVVVVVVVQVRLQTAFYNPHSAVKL